MRQWWPKNKQHFETKEYHKLRPLGAEHPPEEEQIESLNTIEESEEENVPATEPKPDKAVMPSATHPAPAIEKSKPAQL